MNMTRRAIDISYIDFQMAFEKVPHKYLIAKLKTHGNSMQHVDMDRKLAEKQEQAT